jgi:DNA-directed RNA polymerase subunit RPC12/RpoP
MSDQNELSKQIKEGLLMGGDKNDIQSKPEPKMVIPKLVGYSCPTCGKTAVAEQGRRLMCEGCVNSFLAKNVGFMTEI